MITDEPVRGSYAYLEHPSLLSLPGLEQLRLFLDGYLDLAPISRLTGLIGEHAAEGEATFSMPASPWWRSGGGVFLAGVFGYIGDASLGLAVYTTVPPATGLATSELSMNFLRPATVQSERLVAAGRLIQMGRSQGLSEVRITDAGGRLLAHGTSRLIKQPLGVEPMPVTGEFPKRTPPDPSDPDPWERPAEGEVVPLAELNERSWLEIYQEYRDGSRPYPPVCNLTGMRVAEIGEGRAVWTMPASRWYSSSVGAFYGGALAMLADAAMTGAVGSVVPARSSFGTLDLKVNFLRPVRVDDRPLTATATIVHRGRTIAVATCEVTDADGRRVAIATQSAMLLPGRQWSEAGEAVPMDEAL